MSLSQRRKDVYKRQEGTESFPKQEYFVGNIMDYYIQKGMVDEGLAQINKLLATSETPYLSLIHILNVPIGLLGSFRPTRLL